MSPALYAAALSRLSPSAAPAARPSPELAPVRVTVDDGAPSSRALFALAVATFVVAPMVLV